MSMIVKETGGVEIPKLDEGVYTAYSSMLVDLGVQRNEKFGKDTRKFRIIWTILNEEIELNGEKLPRTISKEYSFSLGEKSNLKKDLQAWRGKAFTEEELQGFNLIHCLNKACQLQIILNEKNGSKYNDIAGIMALPKGTEVKVPTTGKIFDTENMDTWATFNDIPKFMQDKIRNQVNISEDLEKFIKEYDEQKQNDEKKDEFVSNEDLIAKSEDDLPF